MSDRHRYFLTLEDGWLGLSVECPYDASDETRPCWPHDEEITPEPAPQETCVITDWVDAVGAEDVLHGDLRVPIDCETEWSDYALTLHVQGVTEPVRAGIADTETPR